MGPSTLKKHLNIQHIIRFTMTCLLNKTSSRSTTRCIINPLIIKSPGSQRQVIFAFHLPPYCLHVQLWNLNLNMHTAFIPALRYAIVVDQRMALCYTYITIYLLVNNYWEVWSNYHPSDVTCRYLVPKSGYARRGIN